jgi:hypothetical protein
MDRVGACLNSLSFPTPIGNLIFYPVFARERLPRPRQSHLYIVISINSSERAQELVAVGLLQITHFDIVYNLHKPKREIYFCSHSEINPETSPGRRSGYGSRQASRYAVCRVLTGNLSVQR